MIIRKVTIALAVCASVESAAAQIPDPELELCRSTGLAALRQLNPAIKDVSLDVEGMTVAKANTKIENTQIRTIAIGDAYLEKGKQDKANLPLPHRRKRESAFDVLY